MTTPAVEQLGTSVSIDDVEQPVEAPKPTALKLEGDDIPEEYRGKSVSEIIEQQNRLKQALQISEAERLKSLQQPAPVAAAPAAPAEPAYVPLTPEKIQELYEENPLKAIEAMNNDALMRADQHFNRRFAQLEGSLSSTQESWARQEFADEFKVLGPEIEAVLAQVPDKRQLSDKKMWKDLIAYVRGQEGNFEKLWEYKKNPPRDPKIARSEQDADAGFSPRPVTRSETPAPTGQLDPASRRVMEVLGTFKDEAEYIKWAKMGAAQ